MPIDLEKLRDAVEVVGDKVRIKVYVKPESRDRKLRLEEGELVFYTDEPPLEGRANASLVNFLARGLKVSVKNVEIVHGTRSRSKVVEIRDVADADSILERLAAIVEEG
ncbi:DUF167 domain-containing protein [Aeropyrum camini]|uniref:UPF0235 protein ACAM_0142 n=1 Tax=Aeropyrum camini SY1 = JCM 12091 TaxID=1198449 RepID=U3TB30_9CREN|nr:DUF167 domain-containing protein [Aeropyrum camini]BAN89611.1 uncharacterized conserved protein [Aeropyrum camini SY1 = JCM 12091]